MPAPGPRPARRSALRTFLGRPTLGGWLMIFNGVACTGILAYFWTPFQYDPPAVLWGTLNISFLVLNFPLALIAWMPNLSRGATQQDAVTACVLIGLNSILWGYGLAAIDRWLRRPFVARAAAPADPPAADGAHPGR